MRFSPHPLTLRQLQYAVAVAEHRSFRRAAELCHVSQPALSAQVAQLEDALGVRLFERDRRRVMPTAAGAALIDRARRLLVGADELVELAQRHADPFAGTVRLGVIPTIAPYLLPEVMPLLRERFAKLTLVWREEKTSTLVELLQSGELDGAVVALEAELGDLEHAVLGRDPFVFAAAPGHPLSRSRKPVKADELDGERVLLLDDGHCFRAQALSFCEKAGAEEMGFRATSLPTLAQMVAGGAGVTLLPRIAVPTENRHHALKLRPFAPRVPERTIALAWRRHSPLAATLSPLAAAMREAYEALEPQLDAALTGR